MSQDLAETAALISDPGRASMLIALLGGVTLPAGQLAMIANVAPQTASSHLNRLLSGRLITVEQQGRHRYYRLASSEAAHAIEALLAMSARPQQRAALSHPNPDQGLALARTCYSHLAGKVAVQIVDAMEKRGYLVARDAKLYQVTARGRTWFEKFGITMSDAQLKHPRFARRCLDWTERRYHLAGELGSALLERFHEMKWIAPVRGSRAVRVTLNGQSEIENRFGVRFTNGGTL